MLLEDERKQQSMMKDTFENWIMKQEIPIVDILRALGEYCKDEGDFQAFKHSQPSLNIAQTWWNMEVEIKSLANTLDK